MAGETIEPLRQVGGGNFTPTKGDATHRMKLLAKLRVELWVSARYQYVTQLLAISKIGQS